MMMGRGGGRERWLMGREGVWVREVRGGERGGEREGRFQRIFKKSVKSFEKNLEKITGRFPCFCLQGS
jgi:hypothetical protein